MQKYYLLRKIVSLTILLSLVIDLAFVFLYRDIVTYVFFLILALVIYPLDSNKTKKSGESSNKTSDNGIQHINTKDNA